MTPEQFAQYRRDRLQIVANARKWYDGPGAEIIGTDPEERPARLLATAIMFNLDTEQAQLLADETEERERR